MTVKGVDVASYQSSTYSTRGLDFVFVKATEGTSYTNPKMRAQAQRARDAGLVVGFYHFLRPGSMTAQARYFVEQAASVEGDPLWADWEDPRVSCADKDRFLAEVKRLRGGTHRVGLYCNVDYWTRRDTTSNAGDALWIAQYNGRPGSPSVRAKWLFHQYTSNPIDTNIGQFADRAALRAWAGGAQHQEDDEMKLDDAVELNEWVPKAFPEQVGLQDGEISVRTALGSGYAYAHIAADNSTAILAQLGAQAATIEKLADALGGGGLTAAEIRAAAEAGAQTALDRLGRKLTTPED
ncbi:glycoside hydrolase family 25 protein [Streptomyces sp. CA-250714]|uniref:glycoside hydrolase family 25 protein n=1 Tax=Streptomyces sp. CA-250714 TaxID=3240060 RepID=UPI003D8C3C7C